MNKSFVINLNSLDRVKEFCNIALQLNGDITVQSDRYVVDGKSVLGILSLNLTRPLNVTITSSIDEVKLLESKVRNWIIEE